jgi:hypothetical protein
MTLILIKTLNSVSFNNDYAVGTTNKPVVESKFEDNSNIKIVTVHSLMLTTRSIELNLNQGRQPK